MKTCAFSSPMEEVVVQLPGGHLASRAICTVMAAKAAAQRQAHGGLHNPFPSRITL